MPRQIDQDLERIRDRVLRMAGLAEEMIDRVMQSLTERKSALAERVIEQDSELDRLEKEIDGLCHSVLVRHQPTAVDHRLLIAVMKITTDLERIGDCAENIARAVRELNEHPTLKPYADLPLLSTLVQAMVRDSLDAFVGKKLEDAYAVLARDDRVDRLYRQIFQELESLMVRDRGAVHRGLRLLLVCRNLERTADHATNIAENVIYYLEGLDVRHPEAEERTA